MDHVIRRTHLTEASLADDSIPMVAKLKLNQQEAIFRFTFKLYTTVLVTKQTSQRGDYGIAEYFYIIFHRKGRANIDMRP